ncbi:MAG: orotidine 5'-phosphate decarboxylase [Thermoplasmatales archaeon]|nr:orotidine 5'-phosphate decarboxylase [Thermoplasmatales archaeon]
MFEKRHGVIIACDVEELKKLKEVVEKTQGIEGIVGYKIGANLALKYGLKNIMEEIDFQLPVIYDHQKAGTDIPQIADKFAKACKEAGVKGVIIFPQAGPKSEEAFIDAIFRNEMVPMVGGEMTHEKYLYENGGFIVDSAPSKIYEIAVRKKVEYFILPGNKEEAIKKYHMIIANMMNEPKYCMPGIGRQGGEIKKAFRLLLGYPSYAIVGSSIYDSDDIEKSAKLFAKEVIEFE